MSAVSEPLEPLEADAAAAPHGAGCTAEVAECTCPEFCERDHDTD
jgi:hypothetical protein